VEFAVEFGAGRTNRLRPRARVDLEWHGMPIGFTPGFTPGMPTGMPTRARRPQPGIHLRSGGGRRTERLHTDVLHTSERRAPPRRGGKGELCMHQQSKVAVELRVVHACRALGALAEHRLQEGHCRRETVRRVLGHAVVMAQRRGG